MQVLATEIP
jgi:hypothetical protein